MKKIFAILALFAGMNCYSQKKTTVSDPLAGIDPLMEQILEERKAAGFAVAVVVKDKIVFAKGYGYRDYENKLPVTPNTSFPIGSCSKAFTSLLIGLLQKDGKLEYDKPVHEYLPDVKFFNEELTKNVTVRDLMCHRTGLPRHDYSWYLFNTGSRDSMVQRIQYQEPTAPLRQTWQYNNFMFLLQGVMAEKMYGGSWEKNIEEKILGPLGMKTSTTTIAGLQKSHEPAKGYYLYKDSLVKSMDYYNINAMSPAGSINSSVNEMANWVIAWINGGKFNGKDLFPAAYMKEAMSSQMIIGAALPDKEKPDVHFANYGFGWMLGSYRGHYRVEHGGNIDGFSASTCFFPSDSIGIIVLTNQNGSAVTSLVRNSIADRMLNEKPYDWLGDRMKADAKAKAESKDAKEKVTGNRKMNTKPSHGQKDYEGLYHHNGYGTAEIASLNDSLYMLLPDKKIWLRHYHYDVFETFEVDKKEGLDTSGGSPLKIRFETNEAGEISAAFMEMQPGIKPLEFARKSRPKEITKEELKKYEGEYELGPGVIAKFYIKGEKTLYAFIDGQPEYELVPVEKNKFDLKLLKGYSVKFEENEKSEITACSFIQPNGTFKAKKKTNQP
jgi:CubicO group peptidase (beta-lactamase class C family)